MKIRALCCFVGVVCMNTGEVSDVPDGVAKDLIQAGHAERAETAKGQRKADKHDSQ